MIQIHNTGQPFKGWVRTTVQSDALLRDTSGDQASPRPRRTGRWGDGTIYVLGAPVGNDVYTIDLLVDMGHDEYRELHLDDTTCIDYRPRPLPANIREYLGGSIMAGTEELSLVTASYEGAAYQMHVRGRVGRMANVDVWLRHYAGEPWIHGECVVTASNPSVKDVLADIGPIHVRVGSCLVFPIGKGFKDPMVAAETFADGQARAVPFKAILTQKVDPEQDQARVQAVLDYTTHVCGITELLWDGNPEENPRRPATEVIDKAMAVVHNFGRPSWGVNPNSKDTGKQEDQLFVREEGLHDPTYVLPTYLSALKYANRPCHHLEQTGSHLNIAAHPNLVFWDSRPHWHPNVSPDRLGKERTINAWDTAGGWYGADREHWLVGTLCAGARYTGSPALQWELEHQARIFLLQETVDPSLSTSGPDAARSIGYAGVLAVQLCENLRDRVLADAVAKRMRERIRQVYIPALKDKPGNVWDTRNDPRLLKDLDTERAKVYTRAWMPWQQALGAYGLHLAARYFDVPEAKQLAHDAAVAVIRHAFRKRTDGRWIEWNTVGYVDGNPLPDDEMQEGKGAHRTGNFAVAWYPCAPAVVIMQGTDGPDSIAAHEIWVQMMAASLEGRRSWFPPGVER